MAPNPRVAKAFRAMRDLGIIEEKVKPVLKNLLKLYDKNWELIEEENYRALADAIFEQEEIEEAEQKKKHENIDLAEMDEETHVHEEPERPLKRLRLRHQESHILSSIGNSSPRLDGTSLKQPKVEVAELPESCVWQQSQDMTESSQSNIGNATAGSHPLSSQPLTENKGKQSVLPKPLSVQERFEPSQSAVADRNQPFATERTQSDSVHLKRKGKEPLSPQITPRDKTTISVRSSHSVRLKELEVVEPGIILLPKHQEHDSHSLIKPKDEPFTDDMPHFEVPIAVIHPEPLSKESSSSGNGSIRKSDVPEPLAPQSVHEEDRTDGVADLSNERRTNHELANFVDESSSNLQTASSLSRKETIEVTPAVELLKQSDALDAFGARGKQFGPSSGSVDTKCAAEEALFQIPSIPPSSKGMDDGTQTNKNAAESSCEIYKENEQNGLEDENSHSLVEVQQLQQTAVNIRSLHDVNDITKGQERIVISFVNEVNKECLPSFYYIPQNVVFQNAHVNFSLAQIGENCCLTCFGDCLSSSAPCACAHESGGDFAYTFEGLVKEDFLEECISTNRDPKKQCLFRCEECPLEWSKTNEILEPCKGHLVRKFIKECWWKCCCSKQCGNRVVQRGINCNLQVFMTPEGKGWGLRTLEDLQKGAFVCEYVGEILTSAELSERISQRPTSEEHAYSVLLDADWRSEGVLKDKEALCLDALNYGNVARFINHRCFDSNLVQIPVEVETPDHRYYHIAFFTTRKVEALEELTWDYGIDFDDHNHPVKAFKCLCGSKFCRNIKCLNCSGSAATGR